MTHPPFLVPEAPTAHAPAVLVVDDEFGPRETVAFTLEQADFQVTMAERGAEALELVEKKQFDAIVLDIRMPGMNGIETLEKIREIDTHVSVIMLTGYGTLGTAQQAMVARANEYLRKPPEMDQLVASVRKHVEDTVIRRRKEESNQAAQSMLAKLKSEMSDSEKAIWQGKASVDLVHDLANPLAVLIGYSELLTAEIEKRGETTDENATVREYSEILGQAAHYCHQLAENWRITAKDDNFVEFPLSQLLDDIKRVIFYNSTSISISVAGKGVIKGSQFSLTRVFQNLLRNAEEAKADSIQILIRDEPEYVSVSITDDGCGMSEEDLAGALKGRFTSKEGGTGLGLKICKHLLGAHAAAFSINSIEGEGTTIEIQFPHPA